MPDYMEKLIEDIDLNQEKPLYRIIYESLRKAIIKGSIPMGERINEKNYAKALNVSRTPVRVALQRLEDDGIVQHHPNIGIVVTQIKPDDIQEIYQIRVALDILATKNASQLLTPAREKAMINLLDRTEEAHQAGQVQEVIHLSTEFNHCIYEYAEMPHLQSIQEKLHDYLTRFRDVSLMSDHRRGAAIKEHRMIFDYMRAGEQEKMEALIAQHLFRSKEFILLELEMDGKKENE